MIIAESLSQYLTGNPAITALTTEIRPQVLADGHGDPALTYAMVDDDAIRTFTAHSALRRAVFDINCYSSTYATVKELARTIRNELETHVGAFGEHVAHQIDIDNDLDRFETQTKLHSVSLSCSIWYTPQEV